MWSLLEEIFIELEEEFGIQYARMGSYAEDAELPSELFCFWNVDSELDEFYNNKPSQCIWTWNISYYTNNAENLYTGLNKFIEKAVEKGFVVKNMGKDINVDEPNYVGRYTTIEYIEQLKLN